MRLRTVCSTCRSQWLPAFAPRLTPPQCLPLCQRCSCRGTRVLPSTSWHECEYPFTRQRRSSRYRKRLRFGPLTAGSRRISSRTHKLRRCVVSSTLGFRWLVPCPGLSPLTCPRPSSCKCLRNSTSLQHPSDVLQPARSPIASLSPFVL